MLSEDQLIAGLKNGTGKAIDQLIDQYQHYVYTICFAVLRIKEEAEEATQDTFIKALHSAPKYIKKGKLSTWIYPIAHRTSLDYLRKRKNNISLDHIDAKADEIIEIANDEKNIRVKAVMEAIGALPPEEAGLIRMFYLEQLNISELSHYLDSSESNIKSQAIQNQKKTEEYG